MIRLTTINLSELVVGSGHRPPHQKRSSNDVCVTSAITPIAAQKRTFRHFAFGEALGIDLELEAQEKAVGPFRADILCKDIGTDHWVLIENQLERTDHSHLGQLLTYASGLEAVTVVWIAARFTEEHRATLDWLNKITNESFRFFGLEVELWRIGNSPAAPKFNIVSKPNDWSQSVAQAARAIDDAELSETRIAQREYWAALNPVLAAAGGPVSGNRKPQPQSWMAYGIGRSGFNLGATMIRPRIKYGPSSTSRATVRRRSLASSKVRKTRSSWSLVIRWIGRNFHHGATAGFRPI